MHRQPPTPRRHSHRAAPVAALAFALLATACAPLPATPSAPAPALAGTSWRLLAFQPSGAGAPVTPSEADQYRLDFGADGRLVAKLDCNRGTGTYALARAEDGGQRVTIGPLGSTRMMCPPTELGTRLPRAIEGERSYRIEGERLQIDAAGRAGVYVWERVTANTVP